jgi:hypothetical protein
MKNTVSEGSFTPVMRVKRKSKPGTMLAQLGTTIYPRFGPKKDFYEFCW